MNIKIKSLSVLTILIFFLFCACVEEPVLNDEYDNYVGLNIKNGYLTVQDAIDNSSRNESIFIYEGIYNEVIVINKSLTIIAENNNTIISSDFNNSDEKAIITISADNCSIEGLTINNSKKENKINGILIKSSNNRIINNTIKNFEKGIYIESDYNKDYKNNIIKNNSLIKNNYGIHVVYSNYNNISYNYIITSMEYGIYILSSDRNKFFNNTFLKNNYGLRIKGSRENEIFNNNIIQNQKGLYFCCGARNNVVYYNNFIENNIWHANDALGNKWDNNNYGNYWDDYSNKYPNSEIIDCCWNIPYNISGGNYIDNFPLVNPI
jgi:parallel beta-helix repeat protein